MRIHRSSPSDLSGADLDAACNRLALTADGDVFLPPRPSKPMIPPLTYAPAAPTFAPLPNRLRDLLSWHEDDVPRLQTWLSGLPAEDFDAVVSNMNWQRHPAWYRKPCLMNTIIARRDSLSVPVQADLLVRWMKLEGRNPAHAVNHFLLSTLGDDLASLKTAIQRVDYGSLCKYVWSSRARNIRHTLCEHFGRESAAPEQRRVVSDIDNTLLPSRDRRFPRGMMAYPGILELYAAIVKHPKALSQRVMFLSARPGLGHDWNSFSRHVVRKTHAILASAGFDSHVLFSDLWHCLPRPWLAPLSRLGVQKAVNFERWLQVHPEHVWAFFGDSGQGDILAGVKLLQRKPSNLLAVFIHEVGHITRPLRHLCETHGVILYRSAPHAALQAHARGMLSRQDVLGVVDATLKQLDAISKAMPAQRRQCLKALQPDIDAALAALEPADQRLAHNATS